jgi:hypothetical protein
MWSYDLVELNVAKSKKCFFKKLFLFQVFRIHLESRLNEEQTNKSMLNEKSKDSDAEIATDSIR